MSQSHTDPPPLFAAAEPIFPRRVTGKFRTLKWWIMGVTLGVYYLLPWIRWDRGPNLPDQAVLVDLANRRFYFFFIEIWPQEFYFVAGLLIMAGLGLFLFTAALGRVWCGYTCPQTVWTDLFILVERWIEGDRNARVRLWKQPWNAEKIRKRAIKWAVWLAIAVATGGAWIFYFADAPTLLAQFVTFSAPPVAYATVGVLTATTFVLGGFMREQVCLYMCPWPRIQSAMIDEQTLTVAYRDWRGEPRGKHRKGAEADRLGDCIDCSACVNVCPTGVDIREGQQMGCITCALCIDACDDVMDKIGKPRGLIDYVTLHDMEAEAAGGPRTPVWRRVFRPRMLIYFALWAGVGLLLVGALVMRTDLTFSIEKVRNPVNITLSDGSVRNAYELRLRNMSGYDREFRLSIEGAPVELELQGVASDVLTVPADDTFRQRAYLTAAPGSPAARGGLTPLDIVVEDVGSGRTARESTVFAGTGK